MRLPLLPLLIIIIVNFLTDYAIYKQIIKSGASRFWKNFHVALSSLLFLIIVVILALPKKSISNTVLVDVMWMIYCYFSIYIPKYIYLIFLGIANLPCIFRYKRIKAISSLGLVLSLLLFVFIWWSALVTRNSVKVNEIAVSFSELPRQFDGYRIVQISDMHVGSFGKDTTFISKVVNTVNNLHPDLILFTGDIANRETPELIPYVNTLSQLKAKDGVISVLGNHDYGDYKKWSSDAAKAENLRLMRDLQKEMGWTLLDNDYRLIFNDVDSIAVVGVENWGEPPFSRYGDLAKAYPNLNDSVFKILLTHNPSHWNAEVIPNTNINLSLSGHTHAMQILIESGDFKFSPAKWKYPQWGGLYDNNGQKLYVNIGLGEVGIPARFGASPEVTLITLKTDEK